MSRFEIADPVVRNIIQDKTSHIRLIQEHPFDVANQLCQFVTENAEYYNRLTYIDQTYIRYFNEFFEHVGHDYDPTSQQYIHGLALRMIPVFFDQHLKPHDKIYIYLYIGNLHQMIRFLIDCVNNTTTNPDATTNGETPE